MPMSSFKPALVAAVLVAWIANDASAQGLPGTTHELVGHLSSVMMANFTPDGSKVATASSDHSLKIWNAVSGEELATLVGHQGPVASVAISPDGRLLASGSQDNTIRLWDVPQTKPLQVFAGHQGAATGFAASADATLLLSAGRDRTAKLWNMTGTAEPRSIVASTAELTAAAQRGDLNQFATADAAGFIQIWRAFDSQQETMLGSHRGGVTALHYHANNQQLLSAGQDGLVKLWQLPFVPPRQITTEATPIDIVTFSTDGQLAATATRVGDRPGVLIRRVETGELIGTLLGHEAPITALAFNNNHTRLATGSADKTVRIWELADAKFPEILKYGEHTAAVRAVAFSADGSQIFSAGDDLAIRHWTAADGKLVRLLEGHTGAVTALSFVADTLASAAADGTVRIWTFGNGQLTRTIEQGSPIRQVALSTDRARFVAWSDDKQIKLWQVSDGQSLGTLDAAAEGVGSLAFSPNNQVIVATVGAVVRTWEAASLGELQFFPEHGTATRGAMFLPDNKTIVSLDGANGLRISTQHAVRSIIAQPGGVVDAALLQGGNLLATVGVDGSAKIWNMNNGQLVAPCQAGESKVTAIAARPDSQQLAGAAVDGKVFLWNGGNGAPIAEVQLKAPGRSLSFSPDNLKLAVACADQKLRFVAINDRTLLQEVAVDSPVMRLAFLPDSQRVLIAHESGHLATWAFASPAPIRQFNGHGGGIFSLVFSHDGRTLASASADRTVRVWDVATGGQRAQLNGHQGTVFSLALSADSALLVSASGDGTIRLWDWLGGRQLKQIDAPGALYTVALHPDGNSVAAAGIDRKIYLFDAVAGTLRQTLEGHPDYIYRVTFNHAGNRLLSCGYGGNLMVWEYPGGKQLFAARAKGVLNYTAYSTDDTRLVTASDDGAARILDVPASAR